MPIFLIPVPDPISKSLRSLECPGERDASDHITLMYLGGDEEYPTGSHGDHPGIPMDGSVPRSIQRAIDIAHRLARRTAPFEVSTSIRTSFDPGSDGVPLIAKVESPRLMAFQSELKSMCRVCGVPYDDTFPTYRPHITMSYADPSEGPFVDVPIQRLTWTVTEFRFYWGWNGAELSVTFPLNPDMRDRLMLRYLDG